METFFLLKSFLDYNIFEERYVDGCLPNLISYTTTARFPMSYGSTAKVLRVDLTSGKVEIEELSEAFYRLYPGGKALAGYFLLNEMPAHTDPFAPETVLYASPMENMRLSYDGCCYLR